MNITAPLKVTKASLGVALPLSEIYRGIGA
jgi:hypothetical protein